ncbi:S8 family serine peptidase [Flavobacteriaceae bacterium]|nr:S8 family serine peptidase [Flavobacteriaceae bacterium]
MIIGKRKLISTDLKYFKSIQGISGRPLFDRFKLVESNIIKKYIDLEYQDFLSFPVMQSDDVNKISFYGKIEVQEPQVLSNLENEDLDTYIIIKEKTLSHFKSVINTLKNEGKTDESNFLERAIKFIDNRFVYCYDGIVILGVWGMEFRENANKDITQICIGLPKKIIKPVEEPIEEPIEDPTDDLIEEPLAPPLHEPWYKRFLNWLKMLFVGKGCFRLLLWLLSVLFFLLLFFWLFRSCDGHYTGGGDALTENDSIWLNKDPRVGNDGGIYDPHNPYKPVPTLPGYKDVLPPEQGVLPPVGDNLEINPESPVIIGDRLNILMENDDKSIMDFAKDFKIKYPDETYKVVYYDNVVKRLQIEIPSEMREQLKKEIPDIFKPDYKLFIFDETLFESESFQGDPALSQTDKNWYLKRINAFKAWDITRGSEKITIAIVDNGFNLQHPELTSKVVQPYNVWKHSDEIFPQESDHGTHVAGIALAIADNDQGISGIAPNCKFMPIQVANDRGLMTTTSILDGILYALYQGADVVNISLGSKFDGLSQISEDKQRDLIRNHFKEEERLWREVMRIAAKHNSTIVLAAGNDNVLSGIEAMQRPELFLTVSATDKNNTNITKANFSNYGTYSKISAPGVGIYSTIGSNSYQKMDGTSMAAPIVSGAVALMKSLKGSITTREIICILQNTGKPTQGTIGNLIQIDEALKKLKSNDSDSCMPVPSSGDVQILLNWNNYNDLDLYCTDPNGDTVFFKNKTVSSGGKLEIDMNVEYPDSKTPIENIYWPTNGAPNGTYNVYLKFHKKQEPYINETPYNIDITYNDKVETYSGLIRLEDKIIHIATFILGNQNKSKETSLLQEKENLEERLDRINRELTDIRNNN